MSSDIRALNASTFDKFIKNNTPVLVDFWADWCEPCKAIAPILEEIAVEQNFLRVAKVDIDISPNLATKYTVMSIPTLIVFDNGEPVLRLVGAKSKAKLLKELNSYIQIRYSADTT